MSTPQVHEIIKDICFYIPSFLNDRDQLTLYNVASTVTSNYTTTETHNSHSHYAEVASLDLTKYDPNLPHMESLLSFLKKVCPVVEPYTWDFPAASGFKYLTEYLYPPTGKLAGHTDNIPGWVILVGLGSTATFWVMGKDQNKKYIEFASGDVVVFESSASEAVVHGIDNIIPNSSPPFLSIQNRISLQFRETIATQLAPPPPPLVDSPSTVTPSNAFPLDSLFDNLFFAEDSPDETFQPTSFPSPSLSLPPPIPTHPTPDAPWTKFPFMGIPQHIILIIFSYLGSRELTFASSTCQEYHQHPAISSLWTTIYHRIIQNEREAREKRLKQYKERKMIFMEMPPPAYTSFIPSLSSTTPRKLAKLKIMGQKKENKAINVDFGSYQIRAGFCGYDTPFITRSLWGSDDNGNVLIGDQCLRGSTKYEPLIKNQVIQNYDHFTNACEHIFIDKLQILPPECYVLAQFSHYYDKPDREKLTEVAFESLGVGGWYIATNYVLAAYANGSTTCAVIDIGYENTSFCFMYEGYGIPDICTAVNIGGNHITKYFKELLKQRYSDNDLDDNKLEYILHRHGFLESSSGSSSNVPPANIEEMGLSIGAERYQAAELLFNPSLLPETSSIKSLAEIFVQQCKKYLEDPGSDRVIEQEFYNNIILVGGGSMINGIGKRFQNEIQKLVSIKTIVTADPSRGLWPWLGGSVLGSLSTFSKMWISRPEYEETGPSIVRRKCF